MAVLDLTGGVLPSAAYLSRNGPAPRVNAAGQLVTEAANVPRFDYDPVTKVLRGLLVEAATTNMLWPSNDLTNTLWVQSLTSSPNADTVMETATSGAHVLTNTRASAVAGTTYTASVEAAELGSGPKRYLAIHLRAQVFGTDSVAAFDLATGTIVQQSGVGVAAMIPAPGGRWLCSLTARATTSGIVTHRYFLRNLPTASQGSYAGDAAAGLRLGNFQFEPTVAPTGRIATTTAPVSRAGEVFNVNWKALNVADGSYVMDVMYDTGLRQPILTTVAAGLAQLPVDQLQGTRLRTLGIFPPPPENRMPAVPGQNRVVNALRT